MAKSILFLMCDSGGGHRSVADAITGALDLLFPGKYRVRLVDIMAEGFPFPFNRAGRLYGPVVNRLPRSWGVLWHATNGRRRSRLVLRLAYPFVIRRLEAILRSYKPDIVLSTHPWANHMPAWLLRRLNWSLPLVTMVTDLISIHHWWLCTDADLCLVPTGHARRKAVEAGLSPEKVKVVGLPVGLEFARAASDGSEVRKQLGLRQERRTVLLTGGGDGMGNMFPIARAVAKTALDIQMIVVAGRNEDLKGKLESMPWEVPTRILGFVENMPDLMSAADLLITKAGPSTISEALSCGLPMLISGSLRGQEEGNADWAVRTGAALLTLTQQSLVTSLGDLVQNGDEHLVHMAHNARRAAKPEAALTVAALLDELASRSP
jgi:1,2-diacylglycerol 3-beta-galactosyltransferase